MLANLLFEGNKLPEMNCTLHTQEHYACPMKTAVFTQRSLRGGYWRTSATQR